MPNKVAAALIQTIKFKDIKLFLIDFFALFDWSFLQYVLERNCF